MVPSHNCIHSVFHQLYALLQGCNMSCKIHLVLLCFDLMLLTYQDQWFCHMYSSLLFMVISYDCPSASEAILKDLGDILLYITHQTTWCPKCLYSEPNQTKPNQIMQHANCLHNSWNIYEFIAAHMIHTNNITNGQGPWEILQDTSMEFAQTDLPCQQEMANISHSSLITCSPAALLTNDFPL